jgi:hypothetical protein
MENSHDVTKLHWIEGEEMKPEFTQFVCLHG